MNQIVPQMDPTRESNSANNSFLDNIQRLQNQYYQKDPKNTFFKKYQKTNCASEIATKMDTNELLQKTAYIIPNTNRVWIDYLIFKVYANPGNYTSIIQYLLSLIINVINIYGSFEIHINLDTFSISAAERYKDSIYLFCEECIKLNTQFSNSISNMYIYNTPSVMDRISALFASIISTEVKSKIILINKRDSPGLINQLL